MPPPAINMDVIRQLPVSLKKDQIVEAVKNHRVVIISGETGSGKTTQIPKFCLEAGRGKKGMIGCTQPRRIAAVTVATRIAAEMGEHIGRSVGYKIRFDDKTSRKTGIKLMTDGILLAEAQRDRQLKQYDTIIVDEAHERSLNIDFTLGLLRNLMKKRRDLKLIITSATIDTQKFSTAFDNAPIIEVSGRMFPVEVRYAPLSSPENPEDAVDDQAYVEAAADTVKEICGTTRSGDILVFMPTAQDIGDTMELIRGRDLPAVDLLPLYSRLSAREQARVFSTTAGRKIIVATNVAETALTIPGIKYVIDTGLARIPHYSPRTRTMALPVTAISRSSADQRKGRCGRVENGICIRLYDKADFEGRPCFTSPEILRSNLADVILRMMALKLGDINNFPFIDRPSGKSVKDGFDTLRELGAIKPVTEKGKKNKSTHVLTPKGRIMARIPVDPKLSRILLEAHEKKCLKEIIVMVSALSIADPRQRPQDAPGKADQKHAGFKDPSSDFITLLNLWQAYQKAVKNLKSRGRIRKWCRDNFLSFKRLREWGDIHHQITTVLKEHGIIPENLKVRTGTQNLKAKEFNIGGPAYIAVHQSLLCGYLGNIAHKTEKNFYTAAKGQKAMIFPGSGLFNSAGDWIVAAEFVKTSQLFARTVANIDPSWLEKIGKDLCVRTYFDPRWKKKRGEVVASEQVTLFGLVIVSGRSKAYGPINPEEAGEIFIRHALVEGDIKRPFAFMEHNRELTQQIETLEHKTREKDILASPEEMAAFYQSRLPRPFYNIKTFEKYLKDLPDDSFLRMTTETLQRKEVDADTLAAYPDTLELPQATFSLAYRFNPGSDADGVTVNVPACDVESLLVNRIDRLVPGLFKEKITALLKNLPKSYRKQLVPVSQKADIIARQLPPSGEPLFNQLSAFILERFNVRIPASVWSRVPLDDHLKMRIALTDETGKEIRASRNPDVVNTFGRPGAYQDNPAVTRARKKMEIDHVTAWDFYDLDDHIPVTDDLGGTIRLYPGLAIEKESLTLRLFRSEDKAVSSHSKGVAKLFTSSFPDDFKALEKDINRAPELSRHAAIFAGTSAKSFKNSLFNCLVRNMFEKNIRTRKEFEQHAAQTLPGLYQAGRTLIQTVSNLCHEIEQTRTLLQTLSRQAGNRQPRIQALMKELDSDLANLVPDNFLDLYNTSRIQTLHRYVSAIGIRARRAADNITKDALKAERCQPYARYFKRLLDSLSPESSPAKVKEVESLYWLIEEFKISLFAQEIKTLEKVSPKKLDKLITRISQMI